MEDQAKIEAMLRQGKIDSEQAALLIAALRDAGHREESFGEQLRRQKSERVRTGWRLVCVWLTAGAILTGCLILMAGRLGLSRDERQALSSLNQAGLALSRQDYLQAEGLIRRGIQKDPGFALSHLLLGLTEKLIHDQSGDPASLRRSDDAFQKAQVLLASEKGGAAAGGASVLFLAIFFLLFFALVFGVLLIAYNILASREEHVNEAWAQVLTWYRRKLDLIPALMEAVKAYSQHEQQTLQTVVAARVKAGEVFQMAGRGQADPSDVFAAQTPLDAALGKMDALVEQYPELRADAAYLALQGQLESAEDGIARSRMRFNHSVNDYNRGLRMFPANLVGAFFGFQPKRYFELDAA
jgi:LemA protein